MTQNSQNHKLLYKISFIPLNLFISYYFKIYFLILIDLIMI
jgi:hypothetical protein